MAFRRIQSTNKIIVQIEFIFNNLKLMKKMKYQLFLLICGALLFILPHNIFSQSYDADDQPDNSVYTSPIVKRPANFDKWNLPMLPPSPSFTGPGPDSVTRYDFKVTMSDGKKMDCLKYIPVGTPPAGGWPTVMMVHGYGDNKNTLADFCHDQASYGYYTFTYSVRGQGASQGLSNLISTTEMQDLLQLINWVKNDSVNGSCPGNILIMGGSQGGILPFMAACYGAPVKTIISALAPPNFASSWIENGSIKMTFLWTCTYNSDTARYTTLVKKFPTWVYNNTKTSWNNLVANVPVNRDFMSQVPNDRVPMIMEGSWQDKFFNASGALEAASLMQVPFRMYLGAVIGHGGDQSLTENTWHMQFFNDWFFYWLFNVQNGELTAPKYEYASTTYPMIYQYWTFVHDSSTVPLPDITSTLHLNFHNDFTKHTSENWADTIGILHNTVTGGLTMQQAVDYEFTGTTFDSQFKTSSFYFETAPLATDLQWTGAPRVNLNYSSTAGTFCQFNFQIYDVKPDSTAQFVNRINYTDRNYTKNSKRIASFYGAAHSHIFHAGDRIRIVVTNLDVAPGEEWFLGTNPFVLPTLNSGNHTLYLNANSYIEFPVRTVYGSPMFTTLKQPNGNSPTQFSLRQNYPNPFNPTTRIEYNLANASVVELKVYDITGREVETLVNEFQDAGTHSIQFNAVNFASGIYFYKIKAGNFQDVKRMVLIK
jgi:predicted acyl esterase